MNAHVVECLLVWMSLSLMVPGELLAFGAQTNTLLLSDRDPTPRRCQYSKVLKMLQAKCAELNLSEIPKSLRTDVEILDFSENRLRDLTNHTLSAYTGLTYLYLMDNFIMTIDDGAFARLKHLEVINLETNGMTSFPKSVLGLPRLKRFYIGNNRLTDASLSATPLAEESDLEFLDVSRNQLTSLPHLGVLPQLKYLNVSGNALKQLTAEDVAAFCSLELLDVSRNPLTVDYCSCEALNDWVQFRKIKLLPVSVRCSGERKKCSYDSLSYKFSNETVKIFDNCRSLLHVREATAKARSTWILVASCVTVFLTVLFVTLFCIHRRNRRRKLTKSDSKKEQIAVNNADSELLNSKHSQDDG